MGWQSRSPEHPYTQGLAAPADAQQRSRLPRQREGHTPTSLLHPRRPLASSLPSPKPLEHRARSCSPRQPQLSPGPSVAVSGSCSSRSAPHGTAGAAEGPGTQMPCLPVMDGSSAPRHSLLVPGCGPGVGDQEQTRLTPQKPLNSVSRSVSFQLITSPPKQYVSPPSPGFQLWPSCWQASKPVFPFAFASLCSQGEAAHKPCWLQDFSLVHKALKETQTKPSMTGEANKLRASFLLLPHHISLLLYLNARTCHGPYQPLGLSNTHSTAGAKPEGC